MSTSTSIKTLAAATLTALTLGGAMLSFATPAEAGRATGSWRGAGGVRVPVVNYRGGYGGGYRGGYGGYGYRRGYGGGAVAAGLVGGLALGALAGSSYGYGGYGGGYGGYGYPASYGYAPAYGGECYVVPRRFVNQYGQVYVQQVQVCE